MEIKILRHKNKVKVPIKEDYHSLLDKRRVQLLSVINVLDGRICVTDTKQKYAMYKLQFSVPNGISNEMTELNRNKLINLLDKLEHDGKVIFIEELMNSLFTNIQQYKEMLLNELDKEKKNFNKIQGLQERISLMERMELEKKLVMVMFVDVDDISTFEENALNVYAYERLIHDDLLKMLQRLNNEIN